MVIVYLFRMDAESQPEGLEVNSQGSQEATPGKQADQRTPRRQDVGATNRRRRKPAYRSAGHSLRLLSPNASSSRFTIRRTGHSTSSPATPKEQSMSCQ